MQIKTKMRYHLTPVRMAIIKRLETINARECVKKREPFYVVGWECKLVQPLWKTIWKFLRKLTLKSPYDLAIPLLGIYPDKTINQRDTCTPMFIAPLFTIAKTWKQPKGPLTHEWIKKTWYIYTMEYYLVIKKNKLMPFAATWMQVEIIILREVRKRKTIPYHITYIRNLKYGTNEPIYKTESLIGTEIRLLVAKARGKGSEKDALVTWDW